MKEEELKKQVIDLLGQPGGRPLTKSEIARQLGIDAKDRAQLRRLLDRLAEEGELKTGKKSRIELAEAGGKGLLTGRIRIFPKGHASLYPDDRDPANEASGFNLEEIKRVSIAENKTGVAMDGDKVEVKVVLKRGRRGEEEAVGSVVRIVERSDRLVVGTYFLKKGFAYVQPDAESLPVTLELDEPCEEAENGQKVAVELIDWRKGEVPRGRVKEVIGWPDAPGVDILAIVHKYGLQMDFPDRVRAEAEAVSESIDETERERREDWRDRLVITIDPADAKDHDDAVWVQKTKGGWQLAVHIADVSHYVKPNSELDKEARKRGNSTYLVDRVLPMLPEELSNGICSLRPDEERLTKCALIDFNTNGQVKKAVFVDALINSQAKLAYEEAQVVLDGGKAPKRYPKELRLELETMIREAWKLASLLRKNRFRSGALDLEMDEIKVLLDENKKAVGYAKVEHNQSHQLVEEFMLAANESVAKLLRDRQKPAIYRVHADPDPEKLEEFAENARVHGYVVGDLSNRQHIQDVLDQAKGMPEEHAIKLGLLRSLRRAEYSEEPEGHYGLAKADYAHFTSPIRRYADLVVHRALQGLLKNRPENPDRVMKQPECKEAAMHISDTERNSSFAEQETKTLKLLEWLEASRKWDEPPLFEGVITEVRSMGIFVEATDIMQKGLVKFEELPEHGWRFDSGLSAFVAKGGLILQMGMEVELAVTKVDFIEQRVDFTIISAMMPEVLENPPRTKRSSQKQAGATKGNSSRSKGKSGQGKRTSRSSSKKAPRSASKQSSRKSSKSPKGRRKRD
ncbi:MAG: ribonuclease R [Verrucomicrobiota bacterium JB023]|nr:ribonuclease R [Verrucomicrobiota bacterium JB023]